MLHTLPAALTVGRGWLEAGLRLLPEAEAGSGGENAGWQPVCVPGAEASDRRGPASGVEVNFHIETDSNAASEHLLGREYSVCGQTHRRAESPALAAV